MQEECVDFDMPLTRDFMCSWTILDFFLSSQVNNVYNYAWWQLLRRDVLAAMKTEMNPQAAKYTPLHTRAFSVALHSERVPGTHQATEWV